MIFTLSLLALQFHSEVCHAKKDKSNRKSGDKQKKSAKASANTKNKENLKSGPPKEKKGFSPKLLEMKRDSSLKVALTQQVILSLIEDSDEILIMTDILSSIGND